MAKCKDCQAEVGFMKKRCVACEAKFQKEAAEKRAAELLAAEEDERLARIQREESAFDYTLRSLSIAWDKFEDRKEIRAPKFKLRKVEFEFAFVSPSTFWLIASQRVDDWDWNENNRTILLFPSGVRLVQEHDFLRGTDVGTDGWNNVVCYEEHHINFSDAAQAFVDTYEEYKFGAQPDIELKIGSNEYRLDFDCVRSVAAIVSASREK